MVTIHLGLSDCLELFRSLGVPESTFTDRSTVLEDHRGRYHALEGDCCSEESESAQRRHVLLSDISDANECECLTGVDAGVGPVWIFLGDLVEGLEILQGAPAPGDIARAARHYDLSTLTMGRLENARNWAESAVPEHLPALETLQGQLRVMRAGLREWLRSEDVHERYDTFVPGDGTERVALGLESYTAQYLLAGITGALVISYGNPETSAHPVLVLPTKLAQSVLSLQGTPGTYPGAMSMQLVPLEAADGPEVLEILRSVWTPRATGTLSDLESALQAARALHQSEIIS